MDTWGSPADSNITVAATISSGGSLSPQVGQAGLHLVGVQMPTGWDTAVITFAGSVDGTNFFPVYDQNGSEVTLQAAASRYIAVPPTLLPRVPYLKMRSGTNGTAVNQTADRTMQLFFARYS